jgi:DegV family protein with EDD domain
MAKVRIITDATVHLDPDTVDQYQIMVLPVEVLLGNQTFVLRYGDSLAKLFAELTDGPAEIMQVSIASQSINDAYRTLNAETDEILVIVSSRALSQIYDVALAEARAFLGRCRIVVADSESTSWGLGLVVEAAARAAHAGQSLDQIVRLVRGVLPHIYLVLIVDRLDYLEKGNRIGPAQAFLGSLLRIKPLLIVEEGEIIPMEKVRTHAMATEKLVEFVSEFAAVDQVVILSSPLEHDGEMQADELRERLGEVLPGYDFPTIAYDPVLACHIGPEALGVIVYEKF